MFGLPPNFSFWGRERRLLREESVNLSESMGAKGLSSRRSYSMWMFTDCVLFTRRVKMAKMRMGLGGELKSGGLFHYSSLIVSEMLENVDRGVVNCIELGEHTRFVLSRLTWRRSGLDHQQGSGCVFRERHGEARVAAAAAEPR